MTQQLSFDSMPRAAANLTLVRYLTWLSCFISFTALLFGNANFFQAVSVLTFLFAAMLPVLILPTRAFKALFSDWLPWLYVALAFLSVSWSEEPLISAKYATELTLTVVGALVLASTTEPRALLSAFMCSFVVANIVGLFMGKYALNAGALAMIGIFGSKNAFSAAQAYLFLASCWVLVSAKNSPLLRLLALGSVLVCPFLLFAGRSADAVAPLALVISITFLAYVTAWWAPLPRILALLGGFSLMILIFGVAFLFKDTIFGQLLSATGKEVTLSGRTFMWARAAELISQKPLLGTGYGAFWVQGNPYAEEIWRYFDITGRAGFNFHNQWYDIGIQLGYVGLSVALLILLTVSIRTFRWIIRDPSAESFFFIGFVWILNMRSLLESEIFSQFSTSLMIMLAAAYYARTDARNHSTASTGQELRATAYDDMRGRKAN
jgi:exopolysaccharide production protein ExoQ